MPISKSNGNDLVYLRDYPAVKSYTDLKKKFLIYHNANPKVWKLFKKYTFIIIASGKSTYSAKAIFERIRWYHDIEGRDDRGFKLSNNHTAYYSRMFVSAFPEYRDFFRFKRVRGEDA